MTNEIQPANWLQSLRDNNMALFCVSVDVGKQNKAAAQQLVEAIKKSYYPDLYVEEALPDDFCYYNVFVKVDKGVGLSQLEVDKAAKEFRTFWNDCAAKLGVSVRSEVGVTVY